MRESPVLLFDCDDVLLDLLPHWLAYLKSLYGVSLRPEDITAWDMTRFFPSLTPSQIYMPLRLEGFWRDVQPIPGAVEYMRRLHEGGYPFYIVTATDLHNAGEKADRLTELFPFLDKDRIIVAQKKQMIRGDLLVDDAPHNLEGGDYNRFLFTRPHNRSFDTTGTDILRVSSWEDIYEAITEIYPKGVI